MFGKKVMPSWLGITVVLPVILLGAGCGRKGEKPAEPRLAKVETSTLQERSFQKRLRVQGTVEPVEEAVIASRTSGVLNLLAVREGQEVEPGMLLFQVDKENLENQMELAAQELNVAKDNVSTAAADLDIARTALEKAELDFKRAEQLRDARVNSLDAYEQAQTTLRKAKAVVTKNEAILSYSQSQVKQSEIKLAIARKNLDDSIMLAPFGGRVTAKFQDQDEYVADGTSILHLENQSHLELSCLISAVYYDQIEVGVTEATIFFDAEKVCLAPVTYRAACIDPLSRTFEIKVALPKDTKLVSGSLCNVDLILQQREGLGLPADAVLLRKGGKFMAYVLDDRTVDAVDVMPGISCDGFTEILNGEQLQGREFVVAGQYFVNQGDMVVKAEKAGEI